MICAPPCTPCTVRMVPLHEVHCIVYDVDLLPSAQPWHPCLHLSQGIDGINNVSMDGQDGILPVDFSTWDMRWFKPWKPVGLSY